MVIDADEIAEPIEGGEALPELEPISGPISAPVTVEPAPAATPPAQAAPSAFCKSSQQPKILIAKNLARR